MEMFRQNTTFDVEFYTNLNYFNSVRQLSLWEHKLLQLNSWQPDTFLYIMKWIGTLTLLRFYYRCHLFKPQKQLFYIPSHSCQQGQDFRSVCMWVCVCVCECVCVCVCVCTCMCNIKLLLHQSIFLLGLRCWQDYFIFLEYKNSTVKLLFLALPSYKEVCLIL